MLWRCIIAGLCLAIVLFSPGAPTLVDNYLKYWFINYFTEGVTLAFSERETAFGDGRGMRLVVEPVTGRELIVGRIDRLDLTAARVLVDRAVIYGTWYGSTKFWSWRDANTEAVVYPKSVLSCSAVVGNRIEGNGVRGRLQQNIL